MTQVQGRSGRRAGGGPAVGETPSHPPGASGTRTGGAGRGATGEPRGVRAGPRPARPGRPAGGPGATRVPELVPIRHGRMMVSPFAFYPRRRARSWRPTSPRTPAVRADGPALRRRAPVQLRPVRLPRAPAGVRHQRLRRDPPRPWEWDVKRLAASFVIAGRANGFSAKDRRRDRRPTRSRRTGERCASSPAWATSTSGTPTPTSTSCSASCSPRARERAAEDRSRRPLAKARSQDSLQAFDKLTDVVDGERRIVADPPLLVPLERPAPATPSAATLEDQLSGLLARYRRTLPTDRRALLDHFEFVDIGRKVVGVGSVGTRCWIVLLLGRDEERPAVPPGQGGRALGARAVRRAEHVAQPGRAGRRRPAADAGRQRHLPRLGADPGARRPARGTSTSASCGTGRARPTIETMDPRAMRALRRALRLDPGPGPRPLRRPDRHRRLPGRRRRLRPALAEFARARTPTRTNATTRPS